MYKIPANTLFIGKKLVFVPQCHSTNTLAAELAQNTAAGEGTVIVTDNQFAGRGQRGNTWQSAAGENLTLSIILKPHFLSAKDQFQINRVISLAAADYLLRKIGASETVHIKWPNDLMLGDRKAGGILIENHLQQSGIETSIAGIGLNINQTFNDPRAVSLSMITGTRYPLADQFTELMELVEARYLQLRQGRIDALESDYLTLLYRRNKLHQFSSAGEEWEGTITGVDHVGRLIVLRDEQEKIFAFKEIAFLW